MKIITNRGTIDTDLESIVIVFDDDNQLNEFLTTISLTPVKTSGIRIITLMSPNTNLSPIQKGIIDILNGMDGIGCNNSNENNKIIDESIESINKILKF